MYEMKTGLIFFGILLSNLLFYSCKDEIDSPNLQPCEEVVEGWAIHTSTFPEVPAQRDLFFLDDQIGYTTGNAGTILKTFDGGQNWTILHSYLTETGYNPDAATDAILQAVCFINDSIGFAGGDGENDYFNDVYTDAVFLKTSDGGVTWNKTYLDGIEEIEDLVFFDSQNGIGLFTIEVANQLWRRQILISQDGGIQWSPVPFPNSKLESLEFVTMPSRIMVIAENNERKDELLFTTDHGLTWQSKELPGENCSTIYFMDDQFGFAYCYPKTFDNSFFQTKDGGETWTEIETPFSGWDVIHFSSPMEGFVIAPVYEYIQSGWEGFDVLVSFEGYQTFDGGSTWTKSEVYPDCNYDGHYFGLTRSSSTHLLYILDYPSFHRFEKL